MTTTMTRTDIHRPSAAEFDPEAYEFFAVADLHPTEGYRPVELVARLVEEGWSFRGAPHGSGQCSHCGAHLRYAALMGHTATKTLLYVGETCLDNRFSLTAPEFARMRREAAARAEQTRLQGRANQFYAEHPDLVDLTYVHNIEVAGGTEVYSTSYNYGADFATYAEAEAALQGPNDYVIIGYDHRTTWGGQTRMGKWVGILGDMAGKVHRYGDLSDKQIAFARKMLGYLSEAEVKRQQREAEQAAKVARGATVTAGRQVIEGEVTSTKWFDNDFGGSLKMRVVDGDLAYWGTVPRSLDVATGDRVRFTATVEPSKDDPSFGFFKRPAKAEVL